MKLIFNTNSEMLRHIAGKIQGGNIDFDDDIEILINIEKDFIDQLNALMSGNCSSHLVQVNAPLLIEASKNVRLVIDGLKLAKKLGCNHV